MEEERENGYKLTVHYIHKRLTKNEGILTIKYGNERQT